MAQRPRTTTETTAATAVQGDGGDGPPGEPGEEGGGGAPARAPATARLVGLDLARGLAVFGMYAAHVGPDPDDGGTAGWFMELAHGRSSALFALLAGVTLVIIAGRRTPRTGRAGRQAAVRIVVRAAVLLVLGSWLTSTDTPVDIILAYYGLYFLLALPFARLRARTLAVLAAAWALLGPQLLYVLDDPLGDGHWVAAVSSHDPFHRLSDGVGVLELLVTGGYPALAWMPFVLAGMAVGRLDLDSRDVRARLARLAAALAVLGYGLSWVAIHLVPQAGAPQAWWSDTGDDAASDGVAGLLIASPHSETTLSVVGNTGVALAVVVAALAAVDLFPAVRRLAGPVIAVGTMSLSAYVFHLAAIHYLHIDDVPGEPPHVLLGFILAAAALATGWRRLFGRGPVESVIRLLTWPVRWVR